jgi:hypothetical protein
MASRIRPKVIVDSRYHQIGQYCRTIGVRSESLRDIPRQITVTPPTTQSILEYCVDFAVLTIE